MTRMLYPPALERSREQYRFDPIVEGARYGLSRELSLVIWERVCTGPTDSTGQRDEEQARQRFHKLAARGGRLRPDPGRVTRVDVEINGGLLGAWSLGELGPRTPGRKTLVAHEARQRMARGKTSTAGNASIVNGALMSSPTEVDGASRRRELPGSSDAARAMAALRSPRLEEAMLLEASALGEGMAHRQTSVGTAPSLRRGFDEYRAIGYREVLQRIGPNHLLRQEIIAASGNPVRAIAGVPRWCEPLPGAPVTNGHALWRVAERHAATLYRRAVNSGAVDQDDPAVESALQQRGIGQPLPMKLRREMERELGVSLAGVRIHTDAVAAQAARALNAEAFTLSEDIFFAEGMFAPDTRSGRKLLVHELTHVAQALRDDTAPKGDGLRLSQPGEPLEQEANTVAERLDEVTAPESLGTFTSDGSAAAPLPRAARPMQSDGDIGGDTGADSLDREADTVTARIGRTRGPRHGASSPSGALRPPAPSAPAAAMLLRTPQPGQAAIRDQALAQTSLAVAAGDRSYQIDVVRRSGLTLIVARLSGTAERLEAPLPSETAAGLTATFGERVIQPDRSSLDVVIGGGNASERRYHIEIVPSPYEAASAAVRPDRVQISNGAGIVEKDVYPAGSANRLSPRDAHFSTVVRLPPSGRSSTPVNMVVEVSCAPAGRGAVVTLNLQKTGPRRSVPVDVDLDHATVRLVGQQALVPDAMGNPQMRLELEVVDNASQRTIKVLQLTFISWGNTGRVDEGYTYAVTDLLSGATSRDGFLVPPSASGDFHVRTLTNIAGARATASEDQAYNAQLTTGSGGGLTLHFRRDTPTSTTVRLALSARGASATRDFNLTYASAQFRPRIVEDTGGDTGRLVVSFDGLCL